MDDHDLGQRGPVGGSAAENAMIYHIVITANGPQGPHRKKVCQGMTPIVSRIAKVRLSQGFRLAISSDRAQNPGNLYHIVLNDLGGSSE